MEIRGNPNVNLNTNLNVGGTTDGKVDSATHAQVGNEMKPNVNETTTTKVATQMLGKLPDPQKLLEGGARLGLIENKKD